MRSVFTGATSPPAISRSVASPDADTPSYWPVRISCTISSEVLPIFTLTLQPVSFSNEDTQSTLGSLEPFSTYPAQAIRLRAPSPFPTLVGSALVPLLPPEPPLLPQPAATN